MPATKPIHELRTEAAALIVERLRATTISQAAKDLGVSRQALYGIRRGDYCPSLALIQRACEAWKLEFTFRGVRIGKTTLQAGKKANSPAEQLTLFDAVEMLKNQQLEVIDTKRVEGAVELVLRVRLSA